MSATRDPGINYIQQGAMITYETRDDQFCLLMMQNRKNNLWFLPTGETMREFAKIPFHKMVAHKTGYQIYRDDHKLLYKVVENQYSPEDAGRPQSIITTEVRSCHIINGDHKPAPMPRYYFDGTKKMAWVPVKRAIGMLRETAQDFPALADPHLYYLETCSDIESWEYDIRNGQTSRIAVQEMT